MSFIAITTCCATGSQPPIEEQHKVSLLSCEQKAGLITDVFLGALVAVTAIGIILTTNGLVDLGPLNALNVIGNQTAYIMLAAAGAIVAVDLLILIVKMARHISHLFNLLSTPALETSKKQIADLTEQNRTLQNTLASRPAPPKESDETLRQAREQAEAIKRKAAEDAAAPAQLQAADHRWPVPGLKELIHKANEEDAAIKRKAAEDAAAPAQVQAAEIIRKANEEAAAIKHKAAEDAAAPAQVQAAEIIRKANEEAAAIKHKAAEDAAAPAQVQAAEIIRKANEEAAAIKHKAAEDAAAPAQVQAAEIKRNAEEEAARIKRKAAEDAAAPAQVQAAEIKRNAEEEAARIKRKAAEEAATILRKAREEATEIKRKAAEEAATILRKAREEATEIKRKAAEEARSPNPAQIARQAMQFQIREGDYDLAKLDFENAILTEDQRVAIFKATGLVLNVLAQKAARIKALANAPEASTLQGLKELAEEMVRHLREIDGDNDCPPIQTLFKK